jgi:AraC-like DNA-binding protein
VQGDVAQLRIVPLREADPRLDYAIKAFLLLSLGAASWLVARRIPLQGVDYTAGHGNTEISRVYQVPVRHGQAHVGFSFSAHWLNLPVVQSRQSLGEFLAGAPGNLIVKYRDTAIDCLLNTPWPLPEIAERVGFSEASTFHRAFKQWTGVAPGEYRLAHGPN